MNAPTLAGTKLDQHFHVCAFFRSRDEQYEALTPFHKEAIDCGEKTMHIVDPQKIQQHLRRLDGHGIDTRHSIESGQLEVLGWDRAYLDDGVFDSHRMLSLVDSVFAVGKSAGFSRLRITGDMGWAFSGAAGTERLIEYEALVNNVLNRNRQPAVCAYDVSRLTGTMMIDILRCHPLMLIGGIVQESPYYISPEELLPQLRKRDREAAN